MHILDPEYIVKTKRPDIYKAEISSGRSAILFFVAILFLARQNWATYSCYIISIVIWSYQKILIYRASDKQFIIQYNVLFYAVRKKIIHLNNIKRLLLGYYIFEATSDASPLYKLEFQTTDDKDILVARREGRNTLDRIGKDISMYLPAGIKYVLMID